MTCTGWRWAPPWLTAFCLLAVLALPGNTLGAQALGNPQIEEAVILLEVTSHRGDWYTPWQRARPEGSTGSGFLIGQGRIMTNAHVVSDARQIIVRRNGDPTPFYAEVEFIAHDSDLAIVKVTDPEFARGIKPLPLGDLPTLRSRVRTYGYPAGGEKISRTEGVVSRIQFITYLHSSADNHLGIQTDSAINPGNSGGPVVQNGQVVGIAFQTNTRLNDVGYIIPSPVIKRFLRDVTDGSYEGYGELGILTSNLFNPAYREYLGLPGDAGGVVVDRLLASASAEGIVQPDDVILAIDGMPVASDGTIYYQNHRLGFEQLAEDKLLGESLELSIWRAGEKQTVSLLLNKLPNTGNMRSRFDELPAYNVYAGLVFMNLERELLKTFGNFWSNAEEHLLYNHFFKQHEIPAEAYLGTIVLTRVLPHRINSAYRGMVNSIVKSINGRPVHALTDVVQALAGQGGGFHELVLAPGNRRLVLDREQADLAQQEINRTYGITMPRRLP